VGEISQGRSRRDKPGNKLERSAKEEIGKINYGRSRRDKSGKE